jgi:hypothetical protein
MGVLGTYRCCLWSVPHDWTAQQFANRFAAAFLGALIVGVALHYHKIVENEYYGYPEEWFPSVSATIGDRYPERSVFMLLIANTSGTRGKILDKGLVKLTAE